MTATLRKRIGKSARYLVILAVIIAGLLPLIYIAGLSVKPQILMFTRPPVRLFTPSLENYVKVLRDARFLQAYRNTIIVAALTVITSVYLGMTCAYALARSRSRLGRAAGVWILLVRMAPQVGFALPFYIILRRLQLLDTYPGLVLVYLTRTLPFVTWMMVGFIRNVPVALEESARIDGCTRIGTLFRITLPLSVPGLVTCAVFTTIMSWNEFFYALVISSRKTFTAPLVLRGYISDTSVDWGVLAAASLIVAMPVVIFGVLMRKGMISGLARGALK